MDSYRFSNMVFTTSKQTNQVETFEQAYRLQYIFVDTDKRRLI